jgi:hypothetical protein
MTWQEDGASHLSSSPAQKARAKPSKPGVEAMLLHEFNWTKEVLQASEPLLVRSWPLDGCLVPDLLLRGLAEDVSSGLVPPSRATRPRAEIR